VEVLVARQPIFDRKKNVFAYELLFQPKFNDVIEQNNGEYKTSSLLSKGFLSLGMNTLTRGKKAFINFSRNLVVNDYATSFPNETLGIELLDPMDADAEFVTSCQALRKNGYILVFTEQTLADKNRALYDNADIIKVDCSDKQVDDLKAIAEVVNQENTVLLAHRVDSLEKYNTALDVGFTYFQGDFFCKPEIVEGRDFSPRKLAQLQLLADVNSPDLTKKKLEDIFKRDASLSYKLLSYINSVHFGFAKKITSIEHALALIGMMEAKKLLSLIVMSSLGKEKTEELMLTAVIRATVCELLAPLLGLQERASELYLVGLFSLLDVFLDQKMSDIVPKLPLSEDIQSCLLDNSGPFGDAHNLVSLYEKADWPAFLQFVERKRLNQVELLDIFLDSIKMANDFVVN
jgi:EAL and modified HD-GYP domain-containing signal transduction protein